jgi:hypothetical protein
VSPSYDVGTAGNVSAQAIHRYIERLTHIGKRIQAGLRVTSRPQCSAFRQLQDFVADNAASNHALLGETALPPRRVVTRPYVEEAGHVGL